MNRFNIASISEYLNRWCLFKEYCTQEDYTPIFIQDIRRGIVRYHGKDGCERFCNVDMFDNKPFIVSPFQDIVVNDETYSDRVCSGDFMMGERDDLALERERKTTREHEIGEDVDFFREDDSSQSVSKDDKTRCCTNDNKHVDSFTKDSPCYHDWKNMSSPHSNIEVRMCKNCGRSEYRISNGKWYSGKISQ